MKKDEQGNLVSCVLVRAFWILQWEVGGSWPEGPVPSSSDRAGRRGQQKEQASRERCLFERHQYSDGRSSVVELRPASVMIQIVVVFDG